MQLSAAVAATLLFTLSTTWASDAVLEFPGTPMDLGALQQGDSRHVVLKVHNASGITVHIETAMSQNVGSDNFRFPTTLDAGKSGTIEFDFSTAYLEGPFTHNIVVVETDGTPHVAQISGSITAPIEFSARFHDIGYVENKSTVQVVYYAWSPVAKGEFPLALDKETSAWCKAKFEKVHLDVSDYDNIREGGKTFGYRITLEARMEKPAPGSPTAREKSIRRLVSMKSSLWPSATPETMMVGYWKQAD